MWSSSSKQVGRQKTSSRDALQKASHGASSETAEDRPWELEAAKRSGRRATPSGKRGLEHVLQDLVKAEPPPCCWVGSAAALFCSLRV